MEPVIFTAFQRWVAENVSQLNEEGVVLSCQGPETVRDLQLIVLELENRKFLGQFTLQETGHIDLRCINRYSHNIWTAKAVAYTESQIGEAVYNLLTRMDRYAFRAQRVPSACADRISYATRGEARQAKKHSRVDLHMNAVEEEFCEDCGMWHLTGNAFSGKTPARKHHRN